MIKLPETTSHLQAVSQDSDELVIHPTDGKRTFVSESHLFSACFDEDFRRNETDVPSMPTGKIIPVVFKLRRDGDILDILGSMGMVGIPFWPQDPAIKFIEWHSSWLSKEEDSIFPFLAGNRAFCAVIQKNPSGLLAFCISVSSGPKITVRDEHRIILPQFVD